jgi:hypothetical protein
MSESAEVRKLLDRLAALDREIAGRRAAIEADELTDSERESHRVALGMLGFQWAKTQSELRATGWRPAPEQRGLL